MNVTVALGNRGSLRNAVNKIDKYTDGLPQKLFELCDKLTGLGMEAAKVTYQMYGETVYDLLIPQEQFAQLGGVYLYVKGKIQDTFIDFALTATGENLLFIEFGAGVFFNSGGGKWAERPPGIANIGEYGKKRGRQRKWYFTDENGKSQATRGTPEQPGMFMASQEMRRKIEQVVKEVFPND